MNCSFIHDHLFDYQEKNFSPTESEQFKEHLTTCSSCSGVYNEFLSVIGTIEQKKAEEPNPFAATRIMQRIDAEPDSSRVPSGFFLSRAMQPVAIVLIFFFAVLIGFSLGKHGNSKISGGMNREDDILTMRTDLFIRDFAGDDQTFNH